MNISGENAPKPKIMCDAVMISGKRSPCSPSAQRLRRLRKELSPR